MISWGKLYTFSLYYTGREVLHKAKDEDSFGKRTKRTQRWGEEERSADFDREGRHALYKMLFIVLTVI